MASDESLQQRESRVKDAIAAALSAAFPTAPPVGCQDNGTATVFSVGPGRLAVSDNYVASLASRNAVPTADALREAIEAVKAAPPGKAVLLKADETVTIEV